MNKIILIAVFLLTPGMTTADHVKGITLLSGTFSMSTPGDVIMPGKYSSDFFGDYFGGEPIGDDLGVNSIGYLQYSFFGPLLISTRATDDFSNEIFRPVSFSIINNVLTLDLDSWTAWWSGTFFNQGASDRCAKADFITVFPGEENCSSGAAVTTYDPVFGNFTADWSAVVVGGPFNNQVGTWHIEGLVFTPVPAAVWLFGSGLLALVGIARNSKVRQT